MKMSNIIENIVLRYIYVRLVLFKVQVYSIRLEIIKIHFIKYTHSQFKWHLYFQERKTFSRKKFSSSPRHYHPRVQKRFSFFNIASSKYLIFMIHIFTRCVCVCVCLSLHMYVIITIVVCFKYLHLYNAYYMTSFLFIQAQT